MTCYESVILMIKMLAKGSNFELSLFLATILGPGIFYIFLEFFIFFYLFSRCEIRGISQFIKNHQNSGKSGSLLKKVINSSRDAVKSYNRSLIERFTARKNKKRKTNSGYLSTKRKNILKKLFFELSE